MTADLIAALRERGLIAADVPAPPDAPVRPWFLNVLMGVAGWVSGLFVIVFLAIALDLNKSVEALITGFVLLCVAWGLYFAGRGRVFVDQLALALSIAGQLGVSVFLFEKSNDALPIAAAIFGMQLILFLAMHDSVARTIATFFASIAWVFVVRFALRPHEGGGAFFDPQGHFVAPLFGVWTLPLEWLLTWAPPIALIEWLRRTETRWMARAPASFARPALTGLLLGISLGGVAAEPVTLLLLDGDELGRSLSAWALFPLLSIALAMFAAVNAFALRSAGLSGVAIVAALAHLARFYYLYGTTLTVKSLIMLIVGAVLLGAARLIGRRLETAP
jgi:hypothetical protein